MGMIHFETTTPLLPHQELAVAKMLPTRVGALFMDMGTGKTRVLLEVARLRYDKWDVLFWFVPVSLKETIRQQILEHTTVPSREIAVWGIRESTTTLPQGRIHVIGIESMSSSNRVVMLVHKLMTDRSFAVVDESGYIKGAQSKRTKWITKLSAKARYRMILTGTPISQGVVDLYAQMRFLSERILGYRSFWAFANNHLEYEKRKCADGTRRKTGRIVASHNCEWLAAKIAPYVYQVKKEECLRLPDKLYSTWWVTMTVEQRELYEEAKHEILAQWESADWQAWKIFELFTVLQTIVCGFWRRNGELIRCQHERVDALLSVIGRQGDEDKVIVWCKYQAAVREIATALSVKHGAESVAEFHGQLSERRREEELGKWREGKARFLLATQSAGGHGLTLNEARVSIFYADGFKYSDRIQAEDRNHRIGQKARPLYVSLRCAESIDTRIASAIARKSNVKDEFMKEVGSVSSNGMKRKILEMVKAL